MDGHRFDEITKLFSAGVSRRAVVRGAVAGISGVVLTALGRGAGAAPNACAVGCANLQGPQKAACKQACRECDGDFSRVCIEFGPFGPVSFSCCPEGTFCVGDVGVCCPIGSQPCFGPGGEFTCCPEGTFCNFETGACDPLTICPSGEPADNCFAGVLTDCSETGCGLVESADGEGCDCIERFCTEIPCVTDADCESRLCVTVPGCCIETTFCALPCGAAPVSTEATGRRWGP